MRPTNGGRVAATGAATTNGMIRLVIADDQALVRSGFAMILNAQLDFEVVGEAADGQQALDLARRLRPDLILMDVRMPRLDGIAATRELFATAIGAVPKVVMLTTVDLDAYVYEALRAGASGFLLKDVSRPEDFRHGGRATSSHGGGVAWMWTVRSGRSGVLIANRPGPHGGHTATE
jgi:DNA-binding NarL/FixJ family response regulator